jgi:hypothetical protein
MDDKLQNPPVSREPLFLREFGRQEEFIEQLLGRVESLSVRLKNFMRNLPEVEGSKTPLESVSNSGVVYVERLKKNNEKINDAVKQINGILEKLEV